MKNSCSAVHADAEWFYNFGESTGWRVGHAGWETGPGYSQNVTQYSNHWRIKAGNFNKIANIDTEKFERLDKHGFSKTEIKSNVILSDNMFNQKPEEFKQKILSLKPKQVVKIQQQACET